MGSDVLSEEQVRSFANFLDAAEREGREVEKLTTEVPTLTLRDAYRIQDAVVSARIARGERVIGYKLGLTSKAKMKQMNVDSPIYGVLTDRMLIQPGGSCSVADLIHPKIEPEIAFLIGDRELRGGLSVEEVLQGCRGVCAAMEVIDSRYKDFRFELPDVIADNCSSTRFVLGSEILKPGEVHLQNLGMILSVNGQPVQFGSSAAILGHPAAALAELCRMLDDRGLGLPAGSIVLAGAATAAVPLPAGAEVVCQVESLGRVAVST